MTASTTIVAETQSKKTTASAQVLTEMFAIEVSAIAGVVLVTVAVAGFLYLRSRKKRNRLLGADPARLISTSISSGRRSSRSNPQLYSFTFRS